MIWRKGNPVFLWEGAVTVFWPTIPAALVFFIYAPYRVRYENCIKRLGMMPSVAEKMIKNVDKSRIQYHRRYCKGYQDELTGKDLAIDSGRFGIEGAAQIIKSVMWAKGIIG